MKPNKKPKTNKNQKIKDKKKVYILTKKIRRLCAFQNQNQIKDRYVCVPVYMSMHWRMSFYYWSNIVSFRHSARNSLCAFNFFFVAYAFKLGIYVWTVLMFSDHSWVMEFNYLCFYFICILSFHRDIQWYELFLILCWYKENAAAAASKSI